MLLVETPSGRSHWPRLSEFARLWPKLCELCAFPMLIEGRLQETIGPECRSGSP